MEGALFPKREFNKHRKLFIQNVPPVTHQDVRIYLGDIVPADIVISKRWHHVIITLKHSEDIENALYTCEAKLLAGHNVKLELYPRRMMLYICGLPLHYNQENYMEFLSSYGEVETAFLAVSSKLGDSKGYGFVEFAHNRATLEEVQRRVHGSTLEGRILYCGLVSDMVRSYEDTLSTTLYCACDPGKLPTDSYLKSVLECSQRFTLDDGRYLYIINCPTVDASERLWYYSRAHPHFQLNFAMPAVSASQIYQIINRTKKKFPTIDSKTELRYLLLELFNGNFDLVKSIEAFLEQMEFRLKGQPLTVNVIMNLVNLLNLKQPPPNVPSSSVPSIATQIHNSKRLSSMEQSSQISKAATISSNSQVTILSRDKTLEKLSSSGPVTRSRSTTPLHKEGSKDAAGEVRYKQTAQFTCITSNDCQSASGSDVKLTSKSRDILAEEHAFLNSSTGPVTRQRKRTAENLTPYRKTPGGKGKKSERPVLFEVDLNTALKEMFDCNQKIVHTTPKVVRKLLPEPEKSPLNPSFIGQHAQGIGGLYADSYIPRQQRLMDRL